MDDSGSQQGSQVTLTASKGIMSRTHLGSDRKQTVWSEGDRIYVSSADGKVTGTLALTSEPGEATGTFTGYVFGDPNKLAYSVFPVPTNGKTIDLSQVTGGDKLDAPMVGQINNGNVPFENTCGILRLNLQDANGKSFTISANSTDNSEAKFLTTATVKVKDGVASIEYTSSSTGSIALNNAVGGFMYVPYFINQDVKVCVDGIEVATIKKEKEVGGEKVSFIGAIKQEEVKTLAYSENTNSLIEPTKVTIDTQNVQNETLTLNVSSTPDQGGDSSTQEAHEFVNIPSITEALTGNGDTEVEVTSVVVELPKITETSTATKSVVSFEEIPQGVTVTIQEETQSDNNKTESVEELTIILPSGTTEEDAKEKVVIDMPNTTVTVKSDDGQILLIQEMTAATADETLIIDKDVEITSLTIMKGSVQVFGKIGQLKRDSQNKDEVTEVIIEVGGEVKQTVGNGFNVVNKNQSQEGGDDGSFVEESDGTYTIHGAKGWNEFAARVNGGETFAGKTVKLGADIDLNNELKEPIGVQEELDLTKICFAGTLDGQNFSIKNLKIDNSVGRFTGLFAFVQGATFKNLRLVGGEVKGTATTASMFVGAFLGYGYGVTFINCHNEGCKVVNIYEKNSGYAGGIAGSLNYTEDNRRSYIIACTNSAEVSGAYCPSGITGGDWNGYISIVACANTGKISYSGTQLGDSNIYASGISGALGGSNNWMYGCFTDCEVEPGQGHSALVSDAGSSYVNFHYSYSANTSMSLLAAWGGPYASDNETLGYSSYNDAVDNLNKGIQLYNESATVPCTYHFVKGDKPTLEYGEPSPAAVGNNASGNNFGNGGVF